VSTQAEFWSSYYRDVFDRGKQWLDYSNARVQAQTFGLALEAAGPVQGKRCIDVGCGWGQLARALRELGASAVTGLDLVPEPIARLAEQYPQIRWLHGDLATHAAALGAESADLVFLIEVLQYVPFEATLATAWELLAPGGRLVAVVPNADCPIVSSTRQRFDGQYSPPTVADVRRALAALARCDYWGYRGLAFGQDQRVGPYSVTPWTEHEDWPAPPNRLQLVALKSAA
jgi:2-polyprenyl-3-methyl-5-hydroxy-6-metoxy-1,4-benzoquinol methylase